jgi:hypothetical protein
MNGFAPKPFHYLKVKKTYVGDYSKDDEQADTIAPIH